MIDYSTLFDDKNIYDSVAIDKNGYHKRPWNWNNDGEGEGEDTPSSNPTFNLYWNQHFDEDGDASAFFVIYDNDINVSHGITVSLEFENSDTSALSGNDYRAFVVTDGIIGEFFWVHANHHSGDIKVHIYYKDSNNESITRTYILPVEYGSGLGPAILVEE